MFIDGISVCFNAWNKSVRLQLEEECVFIVGILRVCVCSSNKGVCSWVECVGVDTCSRSVLARVARVCVVEGPITCCMRLLGIISK